MEPKPPDRNPIEAFDAASFTARFRAAEPQLRLSARRFGVAAEDEDDLIADLAFVMLRARVYRPSLREFVRVGDAIARRIVLARQERERVRRRIRESRADELAVNLAVHELDDALDEHERIELVAAVQRTVVALSPDLTKGQRRALALMLRGGPYSNAERATMKRARRKLREVFDAFQGLAAWLSLRWSRLKARAHPGTTSASALFAAAAAGITVAVVPGVVMDPGRAEAVAVAPASARPAPTQTPGAAPIVDRTSSPAASPTRHAPLSRTTERHAEPSVLGADAKARLPRPGAKGGAAVSVEQPAEDRRAWLSVPVNCDSQFRRKLCAALSTVPEPPR